MTTLLAQYSSPPTMPPGALAAAAGGFAILGLISLIGFVVIVAAFFLIAQRAGYNPWLSLLAFIPGVSFILLLVFAFSEWPIQREVRVLKAQLAGGGANGGITYGDAASGLPTGRQPLPPA